MRPIAADRTMPEGFEQIIKVVTREIHGRNKSWQKSSKVRVLRGPCSACGKVYEKELKKFGKNSKNNRYYCSKECMWKRNSTEYAENKPVAPVPVKKLKPKPKEKPRKYGGMFQRCRRSHLEVEQIPGIKWTNKSPRIEDWFDYTIEP